MVKILKLKLIAFILFSMTFFLPGYSKANEYSFFVGVGPLLMMPGSFRLGINFWEFGMLNSWAYGVKRDFRRGNTYSSFGLALVAPSDPGIFAAIGYEKEIFWGLTGRAEFNATGSTGALVEAAALLEVGLRF